jgi:MinD superfamily P-loop ATPase
MLICIASGKGGTGKTTIATNLAVSLDENVQLLDCDVEEPNAHLFMKPEILHRETVTTPVPEVDLEKCDFCGECGELCQFSAITVIGKKVLTFPELCHSCKGCMMVCPREAIREKDRELGLVETGMSRSVAFVHGRLRVGEAMSPPLIRRVKDHIDPAKVAIIDAPPGTSCPVVEALKGADFALLVTEPTPFGLYDLKLAVEAVRVLGIPLGIIINRCDVGDDRVGAYARDEGIPVLMEIPHDRKIAEAYSRGIMMVDVLPEMKDRFRLMYEKIKKSVNLSVDCNELKALNNWFES